MLAGRGPGSASDGVTAQTVVGLSGATLVRLAGARGGRGRASCSWRTCWPATDSRYGRLEQAQTARRGRSAAGDGPSPAEERHRGGAPVGAAHRGGAHRSPPGRGRGHSPRPEIRPRAGTRWPTGSRLKAAELTVAGQPGHGPEREREAAALSGAGPRRDWSISGRPGAVRTGRRRRACRSRPCGRRSARRPRTSTRGRRSSLRSGGPGRSGRPGPRPRGSARPGTFLPLFERVRRAVTRPGRRGPAGRWPTAPRGRSGRCRRPARAS